jgi:carboxyl-terminal processing protease
MKSALIAIATWVRACAAVTFGVAIACSGAIVLSEAGPHARAVSTGCVPGASRDTPLFGQGLAVVEHDYVDTPDRSRLVEKALRAMASSLDANSDYLDAAELQDMETADLGVYCGTGVDLATVGSRVEITSVTHDSPAEAAGLGRGDTLVAIDRKTVGAGADTALQLLRGYPGSKVRLVVRHLPSSSPRSYDLRRECLPVPTVQATLLEAGYGYVRISSFDRTTPAELKRAVAALDRTNHSRIRGLILDLRDNGGGVFEASAAVADAFLDRGVIVTAYGRAPDANLRVDATRGDLLHGAPMAVLVNGDSASASEIVAGALKDHARAILVGSRTYGKGTVQTIVPLSEGAIKLTTARFFTPSGVSIQGTGIVPDILIDEPSPSPSSESSAGGAEPAKRSPTVQVALQVLKQHASLPGESGDAPSLLR